MSQSSSPLAEDSLTIKISALSQLAIALNQATSRDAIRQAVNDHIPLLVPSDWIALSRQAENGSNLRVRTIRPVVAETPVQYEIPIEGTLVGKAFQLAQPLTTADTSKVDAIDAKELASVGIRSTMTVPGWEAKPPGGTRASRRSRSTAMTARWLTVAGISYASQ